MTICKRVPLSTLRVGAVLMAPITDPLDQRIKLLSQGTAITQTFIDRLSTRGVDSVVMSQRDIAIMNAFSPQGRRKKVPPAHNYVQSSDANDLSEELDDQIESAPPSIGSIPQPLSAEIAKPNDCSYADGLAMQWAAENATHIESISEFFNDTMETGCRDVGPLKQTCVDLLDRIAEDQDALVCLACTPYESDYPSRHGVHLAGVALSIGVEMGLDRPHLMDLGLGCLLHDIGMRAVGLGMFDTKNVLTPGQLQRLADHPVKAVEVAGKYGDNVSVTAKLIAYQIHERCDGSGYPRGRTAEQIHPLSRIAGVADSFVGMLATRKHRLAIQGYYVMAKLLDEMKAGKFDARVIRALLQVASLYPLGSYVSLDNECIGRVIRSGGEDFVKPTIEMWHKDYLDNEPVVVNLKHETNVRITGSIPAARAA